jgi:hypothetical protein
MQRAPSITSYGYNTDGSLTVTWEIDTFFESSESPNDVSVEINNLTYKDNLGGGARSLTIPSSDIARFTGVAIIITIVFVWSGTPSNAQRSSVTVPLPGYSGQPVSGRQEAPNVTIVAIKPKTLQNPNQITIAWSGKSYTDGQVIWGQVGGSKTQFNFKPGNRGTQPDYTGQFTTGGSLVSGVMYEFTVQVRNTFQSQAYYPTLLSIRSAVNFRSVKAFLKASGKASSGSLKSVLGQRVSLRQIML